MAIPDAGLSTMSCGRTLGADFWCPARCLRRLADVLPTDEVMPMRVSVVRRSCVVLTMLVAFAVGVPSAAGAHGGEVVYAGRVDGFDVEASDRVLEGGDGLLYALVVHDAATGLPVAGADVRVTAWVDGRMIGAPRAARYFSGRYQAQIPDGGVGSVELEVSIVADGGTTSFSHVVAGSGAGSSQRWIPVVLGVGGVAVLGVRYVWHRRRRSVAIPRDEDDALR